MDPSAVASLDPVSVPVEGVVVAVLAVVSAVAGLVRAVVPPKKMPPALGRILDLLGSNWGHAQNVPPSGPVSSAAGSSAGPVTGRRP